MKTNSGCCSVSAWHLAEHIFLSFLIFRVSWAHSSAELCLLLMNAPIKSGKKCGELKKPSWSAFFLRWALQASQPSRDIFLSGSFYYCCHLNPFCSLSCLCCSGCGHVQGILPQFLLLRTVSL